MNTLCWLKHQDYLLSLVKEDKKKKSFFNEIEDLRNYLVEKQNFVTSNFYFFIINSFFSSLPPTDVDITLIPKATIDKKLLNNFFIDIQEYIKKLIFKEKGKIFDIQVWDVSLDLFSKEYNFNEPIAFGKHIFKKYSSEIMSNLPGTKKIDENLYERSSDFFSPKHLERQESGKKYIQPVALFEIDYIDPASYRNSKHKIQLINRILNSNNFPESCIKCKRIHDCYTNEYENLIKDSSCPACKKNQLKSKYIKLIYDSFYL